MLVKNTIVGAFLFVCFSNCNNNHTASPATTGSDTTTKANHMATVTPVKDSSVAAVMNFVANYQPRSIEPCEGMQDTIQHYDLAYIFSSIKNDTLKRKLIYPLLLKQYKYHLENGRQGYDLLTMQKCPCAIFIEEFIKIDSLQYEHEFLNSGYVYYHILKEKKMRYLFKDPLIKKLVKELDGITDKLLHKR
jgi:hypothetical protein